MEICAEARWPSRGRPQPLFAELPNQWILTIFSSLAMANNLLW